MNYEEKYKEALERAKSFQEKYGGDYAGYIFPELCETEDERIRKWLVDYFKEVGKSWIHRDISPERIVAYLEKQKEPENVSASTMVPSCWNSLEMTHEKIMGKTENREVHPYKARRQAALQYCSKVVKDDDPGKLRVICYYAFIAGVKWQRKQECGTSKVIPR